MWRDELSPDARWLVGWLQAIAQCVLEIGKPIGLVSVPASIWLLARYSSAADVPFPIGSSTLSTLFVVTIVMVVYILGTNAMSMLWVAWQSYPFQSDRLRREAPHLRSHVAPLYGLRFKIGRAGAEAERRRRKRRRRYSALASREYCWVFAPFLVVWAFHLVWNIMDVRLSGVIYFMLFVACFLTGLAATAAMFHCSRSKGQIEGPFESDLTRTRKFAFVAAKASIGALFSVIPYFAIMYAIGSTETRLFGSEVLVVILATQYMANISRFRPIITILICLVLLSLPIGATSGAPLFMGAALRMLCIGGGIPRELTIQTTDPSTGKPKVKVIDGCLLLAAGDAISIHPVKDENPNSDAVYKACMLPSLLHDSSAAPDKWLVETYPASAIIRLATVATNTHGNAPRDHP